LSLIVLDASAVVGWALPSQYTESAGRLLADAKRHRFIVPHIFPVEVRSAFLAAERREKFRIDETESIVWALETKFDLTIHSPLHPTEMRSVMAWRGWSG